MIAADPEEAHPVFRTFARAILVSLLATLLLAMPAMALDPSGVAVKVSPTVNANGTGNSRILEIQGAVFMGDEIVAGANGLAQIRFVDDTRLVIGPNSRLKIDRFVFNPDDTARQVTLSALRGVFRFISGRSPHDVYTIRTPTVAVGVRGTIIDLAVRPADSSIIFHQGSGQLCDAAGTCIIANGDCAMHVAPRGGGFNEPTGIDRRQRLAVFFPFVTSQSQLDPAFRANVSQCGSSTVFPGSFGDSNGSSGTNGNDGGANDNGGQRRR